MNKTLSVLQPLIEKAQNVLSKGGEVAEYCGRYIQSLSVLLAKRDSLLEAAALVEAPKSIEDSRLSSELAGKLKGVEKEFETGRAAWKAPLLRAGETVDDIKKFSVEKVHLEIKRLEQGVTQFHLAEQERHRKASQEQERLLREHQARIAAEQKVKDDQLAELRRQEAQAAQQALEARTKKERLEASKRALELEAQRQDAEFAREIAEPEPAPEYVPPPPVEKPKGVSIRSKVAFEVTDIEAFYAAYPDYVELKPKTAKINALINLPNVDPTKIPGLRTWEEVSSITRAS